MLVCEFCKSVMPPQRRQGNPKRYCGQACQKRAYRRDHPDRITPHAPRSMVVFLVCTYCSELFTARRKPRRATATCAKVECRRALKRDQQREYTEMVAKREGVPYSTFLTRSGKKVGQYRLTAAERMAIYERDGWTCQLCNTAVDASLDPNDNWAASLDHRVPQSLGGAHDADNLRLAHRWCNTMRWFHPDMDLTQEVMRRTALA